MTGVRTGQWAWAGGGQPMAALGPGAGRRGCAAPCGKLRGGGGAEVRRAGGGGDEDAGAGGLWRGRGLALAASPGLGGRPRSPAPRARRSVRGLLPALLPRRAPWACGRGPRARERMGTQGSPVKSYDYLLKFLLVGDSDVGKGEILESLQDGAAESPYAYSNGKGGGGAPAPRAASRPVAVRSARSCSARAPGCVLGWGWAAGSELAVRLALARSAGGLGEANGLGVGLWVRQSRAAWWQWAPPSQPRRDSTPRGCVEVGCSGAREGCI